ncbi:MAG TPA: NUDIX domain-containing protein [Candidatus Saccharimonadales bacterium]|nr:NUDIX domain-containing protein [Candidatus Saccharimonadales bacterium]
MLDFERAASAAELVDVVGFPGGEPTGEQVTKAEAHAQGLPHRDVHVWLTDGQRLLQQQRRWDKRIMPGAWDISVGEHVMAGESFREAAVRGLDEELGLQLPPERFLRAGLFAAELVMQPGSAAWTHRTVGDNFVVVERGLEIADLALQASEVLGARWYDIDQLEADLAHPDTAARHAPQPIALWQLGIAAMREAVAIS